MKKIQLRFFFVFALVFFLPLFARAAEIVINPEYPAPGEYFDAEILLGPGESHFPEIAWTFAGEKINLQEKKIRLKAPETEGVFKLQANLLYESGAVGIERKVSVRALDLLWEPVSYAPFFMSFSPSPAVGAKIRAQALLYGDLVKNKDEYIFTWYYNGEPIAELSGKGKSDALFQSEFFDKVAEISLDIKDAQNLNLVAARSAAVLFEKPDVLFYEKDELLSWAFNKAITSLTLSGRAKIIAIPFNMSASFLFDDSLLWSWSVDGRKLQEDAASPFVELSFKKEPRESELELTVKYDKHPLQEGKASLKVLPSKSGFAPSNSNSDFGEFGI